MGRDDEQEPLYHYTSLAGLIGILKSGEIFATHVDFLNDTKETKRGREIVEAEAKTLAPKLVVADRLARFFHDDTLYVACFTENKDDLNTWKSEYGRDGYAIGFNRARLSGVQVAGETRNAPVFSKVEYDEDAFTARLRRDIERATVTEDENHRPRLPSPHSLFTSAATLKGAEWSSESEWRLVAVHHTWCGHDDTDLIQIRAQDGVATPYIKLKLWDREAGSSPRGMIESIWIGSTRNFEQRKSGIKLLLRSIGMDPGESGAMIKMTASSLR